MKKHVLFFLPIFACAVLRVGAPVASAAEKVKPAKIEISIIPGALRYATTRFDATAGNKLTLTLKNTCIMPHNLVLVTPGKGDAVVAQAMALEQGFAKSFIPESADVLAATKIVNPGLSEVLTINVPKEPGEYPYLCTFPGHGTIMRGIMRVRPAGEKLEAPVVEKIVGPKLVDALKESAATSKPVGTRQRPLVVRSFVPNPKLGDAVLAHHERGLPARPYNPSTGLDVEGKDVAAIPGVPGGIAVSFGPDFSYVWDSTECRLLYAWTGGFLDFTAYWGGGTGGGRRSNDYVPELEGTMIYKAAGAQPLRLGEGKPKFRGYRVLSGNPEFTYEIGGKIIHEHIMPADPGTFMIHYRIERPPDPVRLVFDPAIRPLVSCDQGGWKGDTLEIPADHGDHFMLLVRFQPGETYKPKPVQANKTSEEP